MNAVDAEKLGEVAEAFGSLFGEMFGARVVPLVVGGLYRDALAGSYAVRFKRRARCPMCRETTQGCKHCDFVGWTVRNESVSIVLKAIPALGTRLRLAGKGDDLAEGQRELHVEVCAEGTRAEELRRAQELAETQLVTAWERTRSDKRHQALRARRDLVALGALMLGAVVLLAALWVPSYLDKKKLGETCTKESDCRSGKCLELEEQSTGGGFFVLPVTKTIGRVCTAKCDDDTDCPTTMRCGDVEETYAPLAHLPFGTPNAHACVPR